MGQYCNTIRYVGFIPPTAVRCARVIASAVHNRLVPNVGHAVAYIPSYIWRTCIGFPFTQHVQSIIHVLDCLLQQAHLIAQLLSLVLLIHTLSAQLVLLGQQFQRR